MLRPVLFHQNLDRGAGTDYVSVVAMGLGKIPRSLAAGNRMASVVADMRVAGRSRYCTSLAQETQREVQVLPRLLDCAFERIGCSLLRIEAESR